MILHFIDRLPSLKSATKIQVLCEAEIALFEEGYSQSTLASNYIPKYRKEIEVSGWSKTVLLKMSMLALETIFSVEISTEPKPPNVLCWLNVDPLSNEISEV